jgi:hypothetical protein
MGDKMWVGHLLTPSGTFKRRKICIKNAEGHIQILIPTIEIVFK